jgi:hypothetical protein
LPEEVVVTVYCTVSPDAKPDFISVYASFEIPVSTVTFSVVPSLFTTTT